ncbi:unnamed protein product [Urochloa humidicola]
MMVIVFSPSPIDSMASLLIADAHTEHLSGKDVPFGKSCIPAAVNGLWDEPDEHTREELGHRHAISPLIDQLYVLKKEIAPIDRLWSFDMAMPKRKAPQLNLFRLADFGVKSPCEIEFSVAASAEGGTEIKIGSHVIHAPKHLSVYHPLMQMLLFARKKFEDTFACLKSTAPKRIFEMANRLCSASPNACAASWISAFSEFSTAGRIDRNNDPDSCKPGRGIKAAQAKISAAWTVATAAPHHATGNRDLLSGFITEHHDQFIHAVDGVPMPVLARGAVVTDAVVLPDVWFVPGLKANMVSVSQLAELDYSVGFGCGECCIKSASGGTTVGKAHLREDGLYVLDFLKVPLAI